MTEIESKHGIVSRQPYELYMSFVDMRNFLAMLPTDKKEGVQADYDTIELYFDAAKDDPYKTDFWIKLEADLNLMMKMMLGGKIKDGLNKIVDGLVDASNGKMPAGFDPSQFKF